MSSKEVTRRQTAKPAPVDVDNLPSLQLDSVKNESTAALQARGASYAREYARIEHAPTILLKNIATVVVAMRQQHDDWLGRKQEYRDDVAEMYRMANIPPDSKDRIQSAVRWHIGNLLRDVLPAQELEALVLNAKSPLKRLQDRRALDSAVLATAKASTAVAASTPKKTKTAKSKVEDPEPRVPEQGDGIKATADHLRLAKVGANVFRQLDLAVIDEHMTDGQRAKLDDELAELQTLIAKLRRHTRKRRSDG